MFLSDWHGGRDARVSRAAIMEAFTVGKAAEDPLCGFPFQNVKAGAGPTQPKAELH